MLSAKGYGPDIMHLIDTCDLEKIGMPPGDAIRLKKYAARWWSDECQLVAKRPRDADYTWWVHSDELNMDVPLPRDRVPILEEDE